MGPVGEGESMEARAVCSALLAGACAVTASCDGLRRRSGAPACSRMCASQAAVGALAELEGAAHALHRLLDDRQAEAGAGGGGARRVAAEERRRQLVELLRVDALAVVAHA